MSHGNSSPPSTVSKKCTLPSESSSPQHTNPSTAFHFAAGLASGLLSAVLLQPADLLKTRVQQASHAASPHPLTTTLKQIFASPHPVQQLWRGTAASALRTGAGSALYFGGLNALRSSLAGAGIGTVRTSTPSSSALPQLSGPANLATGAAARAAAGFAHMPVTVIKVRYESSLYAYRSLGGAARDILAREGWRGFVAGFGATAVRDAPYAGLYVLFYEAGKGRLGAAWARVRGGAGAPGEGGGGAAAAINFVSGVVAAGTATAITNPFDAIKTRLQLMPQRYGNMVRAARMMVAEEGFRCLFDGLALRMARKAMSSALAWTLYEEIIRRAEIRWVEGRKLL